ncbi:shikimate dehydrogenase [Microvirga sp. W0021]|uniref:Shikimate dehydrogenase (NADP(+)) n=1 Tax=Hohaiivirga grylli TaxID=3133970 RepID=A0ABV0BH79_9HYPH
MTDIRKAFVTGYPVKHSRSPLIHNHWLKLHGIEGSYEKVEIEPSHFSDLIKRIRNGEFIGGNVTIPHKEAAYLSADVLTDRARRLKAVNTLWMQDGKLWGDNTDIIGFTANLDQALGKDWHQDITHALVVGAGGASRAVVAGLLSYEGMQVTIINRTEEKARSLAEFNPDRISVAPWSDMARETERAGVVVNTTSLGMVGYPPLDIDFSRCGSQTIVTDIVYIPLITPMLKQAQALSLRTVDGLGMLLHQAVPGFSKWFGITPQVTPELREIILRDIGEM